MRFRDRADAGARLAAVLTKYKDTDAVLYALPRGGVVLGYEVAKKLGLPLDLAITRKIGHQSNPEYAICAVAEDGDIVCNEYEKARADKKWFAGVVAKEREEARRRRVKYLGGREGISPKGKAAIIIDDGIATGLTMKLAIKEIKHGGPAKIVVAVPAAPKDVAAEIRGDVDELMALDEADEYLGAVGAYYENFPQVSDEEVIEYMRKSNRK